MITSQRLDLAIPQLIGVWHLDSQGKLKQFRGFSAHFLQTLQTLVNLFSATLSVDKSPCVRNLIFMETLKFRIGKMIKREFKLSINVTIAVYRMLITLYVVAIFNMGLLSVTKV